MEHSMNQQMKIALATCSNLPDWEVDDTPFHRELQRNGFKVLHPVWDDPLVCWSDFDVCLIRTTWDYSEKQIAFQEWIQQVSTQTKLLNPAPSLLWNLNKGYLFELKEKGIPIAPSVIWNPSDNIETTIEKITSLQSDILFCKPVVGASAIHTLRFHREKEIDRLIDHCRTVNQPMIFQPYISTVEEEGEVSLIYFGNRFSHAVQKIPVKGDYRVQDDYGASDRPFVHISKELFALSDEILKTIPKDLVYVRLDYLNLGGFETNDWVINEVECIEPSLFFRHSSTAAKKFVTTLQECLIT